MVVPCRLALERLVDKDRWPARGAPFGGAPVRVPTEEAPIMMLFSQGSSVGAPRLRRIQLMRLRERDHSNS